MSDVKMSDVTGYRSRDISRVEWTDIMNEYLLERLLNIRQAMELCRDRNAWSRFWKRFPARD